MGMEEEDIIQPKRKKEPGFKSIFRRHFVPLLCSTYAYLLCLFRYVKGSG